MRWLRAHPRLADGLLAAVLFGLCLVPALFTPNAPDGPPTDDLSVLGALLIVGSTMPLTWRRSHPLHVVLAVILSTGIYEALDQPETANAVAAMVAVYSASAWGTRRSARIAGAVTAVAVAVILVINLDPDTGVFFGWALVRALAEEGFTAFRVPIGGLTVITAIATFFGVAAPVWPAWRASRMDVLRAIATE